MVNLIKKYLKYVRGHSNTKFRLQKDQISFKFIEIALINLCDLETNLVFSRLNLLYIIRCDFRFNSFCYFIGLSHVCASIFYCFEIERLFVRIVKKTI